MKGKFLTILSLIIIAVFIGGCSGYVQTNKLPNNVKYNLPKKKSASLRSEALNTKELTDFSNALEEFFGKKRIVINDNDEEAEKKGIYQIGIEKEYFK